MSYEWEKREWLVGRRSYFVIPPRKPALWRVIVRRIRDFLLGD